MTENFLPNAIFINLTKFSPIALNFPEILPLSIGLPLSLPLSSQKQSPF